jgi:hypothetical protein
MDAAAFEMVLTEFELVEGYAKKGQKPKLQMVARSA